MKQISRYLFSLTLIVGVYMIYAMAAVPLIEGSVRRGVRSDVLVDAAGENPVNELAQYFPPGSWELGTRKTLETGQGKILFQDYQPLEDGRLEVKPFTMIADVSSDEDEDGMPPRPLILRVPEGAVLSFDKEISLTGGEIGSLRKAFLRGEVSITRQASIKENDSLWINTQNVQINQNSILTLQPVDFRFGAHYGRGRNLTIDLIPSSGGSEGGANAPGIEGIRKMTLEKIEKFVLVPEEKTARKIVPREFQNLAAGPVQSYIEVTCLGPFLFDFITKRASLSDEVRVFHRFHSSAWDDQLLCDYLDIFFSEKHEEGAAPEAATAGNQGAKGDPSVSNLEVSRMVARGAPATLLAPARGSAKAEAEHLEYDLLRQRIFLQDSNHVSLIHGLYEFQAPSVAYVLNEDNSLGDAEAAGPGWFRRRPGDGQKGIDAQWAEELLVRMDPKKNLKAFSMYGGASIQHATENTFSANSLHLWIAEIPKEGSTASDIPGKTNQWTLRPMILLAEDNVRMGSPRMDGSTAVLEAYWSYPVNAVSNPVATVAAQNPALANGQTAPINSNQLASDQQTPGLQNRNLLGSDSESDSRQKLEFQGSVVRAQLVDDGADIQLGELSVQGDVRIFEVRTEKPGELPLDIQGKTLRAISVGKELYRIVVQGDPETKTYAKVAARGLSLFGPEIYLDQSTNNLWIDGHGELMLTQLPNGAGSAINRIPSAPKPTQTFVTWNGGLVFSGQVAHIEGSVVVKGKQLLDSGQTLDLTTQSQSIDMTLTEFVDFRQSDESKSKEKVDVRLIRMDGGVRLDNRTYEPDQTLASIDSLVTRNATVNQISGDLHADGPGTAESVRKGGSNLLEGKAETEKPEQPASGDTKLTYVHVQFAGHIEGNIHKKEVQFVNDVRTTVGPVLRWDQRLDPNSRDTLGDQGAFITCDRLLLAQWGPKVKGQQSVEVQALGNTHLTGKGFEAEAAKVAFNQGSDKIVLEGNTRTNAQLWSQQATGSARDYAEAKKISYWRSLNQIEVEGVEVFDWSRSGPVLGIGTKPEGTSALPFGSPLR